MVDRNQDPRRCHGPSRREILRAAASPRSGWACSISSAPPATAAGKARAKSVILFVHVGRTEPPRHLGPQAGRPGRGPWAFPLHPNGRSGCASANTSPVGSAGGTVCRGTIDEPHGPGPPVAGASPADRTACGQGELRRRRCQSLRRAVPGSHRPQAVATGWSHASRRDASLAVSHPAAPGGVAPGQNGGWLGPGFDPFLVTGNPMPDVRRRGLDDPRRCPR